MLKTIFSLDKNKYQNTFLQKNIKSIFYSKNSYSYNNNYSNNNSNENSGNNNMNNPNNKKNIIVTIILAFYFFHLKNR